MLQQTTFHYQPTLCIYPHQTTLYYAPVNGCSRKKGTSLLSISNLKRRAVDGKVSKTVRKKIITAIGWLTTFAKQKSAKSLKTGQQFTFKSNLVTLTLPSTQIHSDKEIKRSSVSEFIQYARRVWGMENYVWKAEAQANGNIHFHFVTDVYIPHNELRTVWNRYINKLGYVDRCQSSKNPNSTDIHSLKNIKDVAAYMAKYMSKNDENRRKIEGAIWGCSDSLKGLASVKVAMSVGQVDKLNSLADKGIVRSFRNERVFLVKESIDKMMKLFPKLRVSVASFYKQKFLKLPELLIKKTEELCYNLSSTFCKPMAEKLLPQLLQLSLDF